MGRVGLLLLVCGSALASDAYTIAIGPDGKPVRVLQLPNVRCASGAPGCYEQHVILGYGYDTRARLHELDHVAGMEHGEWITYGSGNNCAVILKQGNTQWLKGNVLCRRPDGDYFQVEP